MRKHKRKHYAKFAVYNILNHCLLIDTKRFDFRNI